MKRAVGTTVTVDDAEKSTADYLGLIENPRVPHAFIVDKNGGIVWYGHSLGGLELSLEEVPRKGPPVRSTNNLQPPEQPTTSPHFSLLFYETTAYDRGPRWALPFRHEPEKKKREAADSASERQRRRSPRQTCGGKKMLLSCPQVLGRVQLSIDSRSVDH